MIQFQDENSASHETPSEIVKEKEPLLYVPINNISHSTYIFLLLWFPMGQMKLRIWLFLEMKTNVIFQKLLLKGLLDKLKRCWLV